MNTPPPSHYENTPQTPPTRERMTIPQRDLDEVTRVLFPVTRQNNEENYRDLDNVRRVLF